MAVESTAPPPHYREINPLSDSGRRNEVYPWDEWANGSWWILIRGIDYRVGTRSFRTHIAHQARRRKLRYTTTANRSMTGVEGISFCFFRFEPGDMMPSEYDRILTQTARADLERARERTRLKDERTTTNSRFDR